MSMKIQKWNKRDIIFKGHLDPIYQTLDYCDIYYVIDRGFAIVNHNPKYSLYQKLGIPEIQDVYVLPNYRKQGIASDLIQYCEAQVAENTVGISVPVSPNYGAAQRLYYKLGYMPDGNGVTYNRQILSHNNRVKLDDDLCLMMVKDLEFSHSELVSETKSSKILK